MLRCSTHGGSRVPQMRIDELAAYTFALGLDIVIGVSAGPGGFWLERRGRGLPPSVLESRA